MMQIKSGWLCGVRQVPVSHFGARAKPLDISLIVIHSISLPPQHFGGHYVDALFTGALDPNAHPFFKDIAHLELSSHLFINRGGLITQYVSFLDRAFHAGRSEYKGRKECNEYSIGIELEGSDYCAYTISQYESLDEVLNSLYQAYPRTRGAVAGHNEIAPLRKTDPGAYFAWGRYR